jgi:signal transduction histidine kinase
MRLALAMAGLSIAVLFVAGILIYHQTRRALSHALDAQLLTIAQTEVASGFDEPGVGAHVHDAVTGDRSGSGEKISRITDASGRVLAQTSNLASGAPLLDNEGARARALAGELAFADLGRGAAAYRGLYHPHHTPESVPLTLLVALPTRPLEHTMRAILVGLGLSLLAAAVAAAWGSVRIAQRLTVPLDRIAEVARAIRTHGPSARIPVVSADAELQSLTAILNEMLAALEAALTAERQTAEAQKQFVADAAHELRSPLANLRGTIEVTLRRSRSTEEYQEALTIAVAEIERLSRLTNDLLVLSRADAGQLVCRPAPCDAVEIAANAIAASAERATERRVHVDLAAPAALPIVADADRLRQVVDNLLDNGLRHAPEGTTLTVTAEVRNGALVLAIRDRGLGLTAEQQARIFDRFFRADESRARNSGGLGLGLSIAKAIVEAHHGTLTVESSPGAGCTFVVTLPAAAAPPRG